MDSMSRQPSSNVSDVAEAAEDRGELRSAHGSSYSLTTLSAHSTNATRSGGVTKRAFLPTRSVSRTARAREHAVQTLISILCPIVLRSISDKGGQPTGVTDWINSSLIRFTASP